MNIGKAIIKLRKEKLLLTQKEFSDRLGITQTYLSLLENDIRKPGSKLLNKFTEYFDLHPAILFWFSIEENDIRPPRRRSFRQIKPKIDELMTRLL